MTDGGSAAQPPGKNFFTLLLTSVGSPLILMGDECGARSKATTMATAR